MVFVGLGSTSCSSEDPQRSGALAGESEQAPAEQRQAIDYFCVDHPCADLDPLKLGECNRSFGGNTMLVPIENLGPINAGQSTAKFWIDQRKQADFYAVPPINANSRYRDGAAYPLLVALPDECVGTTPLCSWHLQVDFYNTVRETNDNNNSIAGACFR
jgi:hypothetical protein